MDASGFASLGPNGQPNVEFSPVTTALATDAHASRIVWGQRSGDISLTMIDWRGQSARGTVRNRAFARRAGHNAPVTAVAFPAPAGHGGAHGVSRSTELHRQQLSQAGDAAQTFATAAADGSVYIWHAKHDVPIWKGSAHTERKANAPSDGPVDCLVYQPAHGVLLAACRSRTVCVWTGVEAKALSALYNSRSARHEALSDADRAQSAALQQAKRLHIPAHAAPSDAPSVDALVLDTYVEEERRLSFLVHMRNARVFLRHDILDGEVRTTVFGAPNISPITSIRCDFDVRERAGRLPAALLARMRAARFKEHKFVCAGTASGGIGIWEWDAGEAYQEAEQLAWQQCAAPQLVVGDAQAAPALVLEGHTNAITALDMTPSLLFAGCEDGTVKALDPLTGHVVRVFNERTARRQPARMLASGELSAEHAARFRVNQIVADDDLFVAAIGPQVLAWRTTAAAEAPAAEIKAAVPARRARAAERPRMRMDLDRAVQEEQELLQAERRERQATHARRDAAQASIQGALDDEAALDYALMLSREEAQNDELSYELLYDEVRLEASEGDSDAAPIASPELTAFSSPPSRAWDTLHHAGPRASTTNETSGPHSKLRTVAVPRSARLATSPSSAHSSLGSTPLQLGSSQEWPDMRPSSLPEHRAGRSPMGAWAHQSPVLRATDRPASARGQSALVTSAPSPIWHLDAPDEDAEDADLRLAMELSLAEYNSRTST